jgi:IS5 family transposase
MLLLKHVRNWSYAILEREVRASLLYRQFTRVGAARVSDAKTMGIVVGPEVIQKIHQRVVAIAQQQKVVLGRRLRVDTTVVQTNVHYPADSSLLGDGVRVLTRTMKRIVEIAGDVGTRLRDRMRSLKYRVLEIGRASRSRTEPSKGRLEQAYRNLLWATGRVVGQAKRFAAEAASGLKNCSGSLMDQLLLEASRRYLETMIPRVQQVMRQARERVFKGNTRPEGKIVSLFEPHTEVIRKGKAAKPTEFAKMVKIQEAEGQIITAYDIYDQRPSDCDLLIPALQTHQLQLGRVPHLVTADAAFFSDRNEAAAHAMGVTRVSIPNRSTKSLARKKLLKKRWFRNAQKWRTGSEGRISLLKRRHGLDRCRYKGQDGMKRGVGLGVIGDNLINIGCALAASAKASSQTS